MRVLFITGAFPPIKCGVGYYVASLSKALVSQEHVEVGVLTSSGPEPETSPCSENIQVFRIMPSWRLHHTIKAMRLVKGFSPDVVHIQYPTQCFRGSLPRLLPFFLSRSGFPVVQTWHEHFSECRTLGRSVLSACDALIHVRPDLPDKLPPWVKKRLGDTPITYIPNASTIPCASLTAEQARRIKQDLSGGKPTVCYFGFAYPNKGLERIFEIADPEEHHLVMVCDLCVDQPYQAAILKRVHQEPWKGKVTVTGFQPAERVGEILAAADAVVFPFPKGAGNWNTSLKAAEAVGVFTIATTQDVALWGYHRDRNLYFAGCDQAQDMRKALRRYIGRRVTAKGADDWGDIARDHFRVYQTLC